MVDVDALLVEISPDTPAGDNLEYDADFVALELAAQGSADRVVGESVISGTPPDWRSVREQALSLFARTKDLRVTLYLIRALLNLEGIAGFASGLSLLRGLIERYWDSLHPELDPDDPADPTRANIITALCDRAAVLDALQMAPLAARRGLGAFGLRHVRIAREELALPPDWEGAAPDKASVTGVFMECELSELEAVNAALVCCRDEIGAIDERLMSHLGGGGAPDFTALLADLRDAQAIVQEYLAARGASLEDDPGAGREGAEVVGAGSGAARAPTGEIRSREDALKMLDKVADFFIEHEPSSPVPLLIRRAQRLVGMDFLAIIGDIASDGMGQVELLGGVTESDD